MDGVSWSAFSGEGTTHYPAYYVPTLTMAQLTNIWAGTVPACTKTVNGVSTCYRRQRLGLPGHRHLR